MKKILITGGGGDIAKELGGILKENYQVFTPLRNELDVSDVDSVKRYFSDKKFDIVVNAAGTLYSSLVEESCDELWIRDINVNLIGTFLVSKYAIMKNDEVRVINISSTAAFNSYKDWTSYCASKAGVNKLSIGLYKSGYDIVLLCPGAIDTKIREGLLIKNKNIMSIEEGIAPIKEAIQGNFNSGDVIFYRKDAFEIIRESDVL